MNERFKYKTLNDRRNRNILDLGLGKEFITKSSKAIKTKPKTDKWKVIEELLHSKETINKQTTYEMAERIHKLCV